MSQNPFTADAAIRDRHDALATRLGEDVQRLLAEALARRRHAVADNLGGVLLKAEADAIVAAHGLTTEELMLLSLPAARHIARPPISDFFVGAVGLETETGNLIFGGNLEFPGSHLGFTVHGEGFVFTRSFSRGTSIAAIAIGEAHPCAHCRQYLSEFAASRDLVLIDPLGHRLSLGQLYPWPFDPQYLGESGLVAGQVLTPGLVLGRHELSPEVADRLMEAGRRAYAPYSKCPSAVVLSLTDGSLITGATVESVAFNPSMHPLQAALIDLFAHGYGPIDIAAAALGTRVGGAVDLSRSTGELLAAVAPGVPLTVAAWA